MSREGHSALKPGRRATGGCALRVPRRSFGTWAATAARARSMRRTRGAGFARSIGTMAVEAIRAVYAINECL